MAVPGHGSAQHSGASSRESSGCPPDRALVPSPFQRRPTLRHTSRTMHDIRYAFRLLRKSPMFTTTVVAILAIGIGATTAIFSVVNAVLLRPLPFAQPERLMQVAEKNDRLRLPAFAASALNYLSWSETAKSFDGLAAI